MSEIKPALTAEEWSEALPHWIAAEHETNVRSTILEPLSYRGVAALCLYGLPNGFAREDVVLLRQMVRHIDRTLFDSTEVEQAGTLADRIEALLPPDP